MAFVIIFVMAFVTAFVTAFVMAFVMAHAPTFQLAWPTCVAVVKQRNSSNISIIEFVYESSGFRNWNFTC